MPVRSNTFVYIEFSITVSNSQTPSLGLGLSPPDCPLNVMVGSWPRSIGLYTDGQILIGSHWIHTTPEVKFEAGVTVGILVFSKSESGSYNSIIEQQISDHILQFNINGRQLKYKTDSEVSIRDVIPIDTPLYPTVSLFSENTRVWCRFCEADIVYRSRSAIGAPTGCKVYSLDGSLLLAETD